MLCYSIWFQMLVVNGICSFVLVFSKGQTMKQLCFLLLKIFNRICWPTLVRRAWLGQQTFWLKRIQHISMCCSDSLFRHPDSRCSTYMPFVKSSCYLIFLFDKPQHCLAKDFLSRYSCSSIGLHFDVLSSSLRNYFVCLPCIFCTQAFQVSFNSVPT